MHDGATVHEIALSIHHGLSHLPARLHGCTAAASLCPPNPHPPPRIAGVATPIAQKGIKARKGAFGGGQ